MAIVIKPGEFKIVSINLTTSSNTTTFTWIRTPDTATTKDVEMSKADHQVHVTSDDNEEIVIECWTCTGFPQLAKFGKSPNINQVYQAVLDHWNS